MFRFFKFLKTVARFNSLDRDKRRLTFYCEGKNYWPHLSGILRHILENTDIECCYVSSSADDPGLDIQHERLNTFLIDSGFVRNWFFENLDTDVMVMTMPDLHQYQIKRSKNDVHYVYVQHSLVSLHMVYKEGAFDHFDTILCSGPHHVEEVSKLVESRALSPIAAIPHGYGRLDSLMDKKLDNQRKSMVDKPIVLIAPTWGPNGIIETGAGKPLIKQLLDQDCEVVLRPHPQTLKFSADIFSDLLETYKGNSQFSFETSIDGEASLIKSDIMVSDWSGAALEYGLGLNKPVLFVDVPRKVNNPHYEELGLEPLESSIRSELGLVIKPGESFDVRKIIENKSGQIDTEKFVYNVMSSDRTGAEYIVSLLPKNNSLNSTTQ